MTTPINGTTSKLELTAKNRRVAMPLFGETTAYDEVAKLAHQYEQKLIALTDEHRASILSLKSEMSDFQEMTEQRLQELENRFNYKKPSMFSRFATWSKAKWVNFKTGCSNFWTHRVARNQLTSEQIAAIATQVTQQLQQNQLSIDVSPKKGDYKAIDNIKEIIRNYPGLSNEDISLHLPYLEDETSSKEMRGFPEASPKVIENIEKLRQQQQHKD